MEDKKFDQRLIDSLWKNTDQSLENKEAIWHQIEARLGMKEKPPKAPKKNRGVWWITGSVAAAIVLAILAMTDTGQALANTIKEFFAPEKKVVEEIEGTPEEKEVILHEKAGYIIYIDEERYRLVKENGIDKIVTKEPLGDGYPEVAMEISQVPNEAPEKLASKMKKELEKDYATVKEITAVSDPVDGLLISAIDGQEWNSPVTQVYLISNQKGGTFVIRQKYFLEAAEGHGARFYHMLKEFRIVEENK